MSNASPKQPKQERGAQLQDSPDMISASIIKFNADHFPLRQYVPLRVGAPRGPDRVVIDDERANEI